MTREPAPPAHDHEFGVDTAAAERGTRLVMWITAATMLIEIVAGAWFNSMALLADGWHMSSHALAIGLSAYAYAAARRDATDPRYAFGTWKIEVLGGFASAVFLLGVALLMVGGSIERLLRPEPIRYREAIVVAVLGLIVNVVCALILARASHHEHAHGHDDAHEHDDHEHHDHDHDHHHHDLNLRAAYLHVIADAATSVLAIVALAGGLAYGWAWLDPAMGIVGAVLVANWARGLVRSTSAVLLDREMDRPLVAQLRHTLASVPAAQLTDLHVWRVGRRAYACVIAMRTADTDLDAQAIRTRLAAHPEIVHSTIEIERLRT